MLESVESVCFEDFVQSSFSGMPVGRMAKIMAERDRFREVLVQLKRFCNGPGDL